MTKARDLSKLLSTSNGKIAGENLDVSFENITDTGTEGTKVASGTTAQRGSTAGQIRFNSETGLAEYYTGTNFKSIDTPPVIISITPTDVDSSSGSSTSFTITGSNFQSGAVIKFIDNSGTVITADTTTVNSSTSITTTKTDSSFSNANEPYDVKIENSSGLIGELADQINVDTAPTWTTASGNIGNVYEGKTANITVSATDAEGDTVSYSETGGTVLSTNNLAINSSTGVISGTAPSVSGDTTINFNLRATANSKNTDRAFNIIIAEELGTATNPATSSAQLYNAGYTTDGDYYYNNDFTGSTTRQCHTRFNTRDGVHWHRWSPQYFGYVPTGHGGGAGNTTFYDYGSPNLTSETLDNSNRDFGYETQSSGQGTSHIWRVGLRISSFNGLYFGAELYEDAHGDSTEFGGGTAGNKGFIGIDHQSTDGGAGNWGQDYAPELIILQTGFDTTRNNNNARNFGAIKFTQDGSNTNYARHSSNTIGGTFGVGGTSGTSQADLWSRYSNTNNTGYLPTNSGNNSHSGTITSNDYFALRIGGWSDNSQILRFRGIFWIGSK